MLILTTSLAIGGILFAAWKDNQQRQKNVSLRLPEKQQHSLVNIKTATPTKTDILKNEAEATHYQRISLVALGLTGVGAIFYSPLTLLGIPLLTYNYFHYLKKSLHVFFTQKQRMLGIFEWLSVTGVLVLGKYLAAAVLFTMFFTAGKLIIKTERSTHTDLNNIFGSLPKKVWKLREHLEIEVPLNTLQTNDIMVVRAGEMIAADGKIIAGEGTIDQCMLTGEAQPVEKSQEDKVFASTMLLSGWLHIQVEKQGEETVTGQIVEVLKKTADFKSHIQSRGEAIVEKGAGISMLATATALPLIGMSQAIALTYSGFGYQMRLAAPLTVLNYLRIASNHGILVKEGRALEKLSEVDTIIFDKTGTLTEKIPQVERIIVCNGFTEKKLLQYAVTAEQRQKHPIAQAISQAAAQQNLRSFPLKNSDYEVGYGIRVSFVDPEAGSKVQTILLGSERFMESAKINIPNDIKSVQIECAEKGHSLIYIAFSNQHLMGIIELRPSLRKNAKEVATALRQQGMTLYIISGDQQKPTQQLAQTLGIENYHAETLPEDKAKIVENLQKQGRKVCFIGDGINDAVALQKSDVAISLHGAATIATDTAEIVLIKPDLSYLPYLLQMANDLNKRIKSATMLNTASGISCITGVIIFGMGISGAIFLYYSTLGVNIANAMVPIMREKKAHSHFQGS
jgi:heavy metal translocating P-type ATPase